MDVKVLASCGSEKFNATKFGGGTSKLPEISGQRILNNFGSKKANSENLKQLLEFIGIKVRRSINDFNPSEVAILLSNSNPRIPDLSIFRVSVFTHTRFGGGDFPVLVGDTILKDFGDGKISTENLNNLLRLAGIEVKTIDYSDRKTLNELLSLSNPKIDLATCGVSVFRNTEFGGSGNFPTVSADTILKNFGTGKKDKENFEGLLKFLGVY